MRRTVRVIWGFLLIGSGILLVLQNFDLLRITSGLIWGILFGIGGILFLAAFAGSRRDWWAIIPGFTLLALGALISLESLAPNLASSVGGALFLGGIGLAFW